MAVVYSCGSERRRDEVRAYQPAGSAPMLNGVDYVEVWQPVAQPGDSPLLRQQLEQLRHRVLLVTFVKDLADDGTGRSEVGAPWVSLSGGTRITSIALSWAFRLSDIEADRVDTGLPSAVVDRLLAQVPPAAPATADAAAGRLDPRARTLVVLCQKAGDFSPYTFTLAQPAAVASAQAWDPRLASVELLFRIDCDSGFDCVEPECVDDQLPGSPSLDYLSRDYASLRTLMLGRMAQTMPGWIERSPADLGVAMVEILAYAGDRLSYYQDAVATESYLGTARRRVSMRRHARLLDYEIDEGCNARTWICLLFDMDLEPITGTLLPAGTRVCTRLKVDAPILDAATFDQQVELKAPIVFETMHDLHRIVAAQSAMRPYTWSDNECCLPRGATELTLWGDNSDLRLEVGQVLVLAEERSPDTGATADADPTRRHPVRLVEITSLTDPLTGTVVTNLRWHEDDALPFPLCLDRVDQGDFDPMPDGGPPPVTVAWGNAVLCDHGRTIGGEVLDPPEVPAQGSYRPRLSQAGVTWATTYEHDEAIEDSAALALAQDARQALPQVAFETDGLEWLAVRDLLASGPSSRDFVVEVANNGRATLRFGDDVNGQSPAPGTSFQPTYRVGGGSQGNIGADSLVHVVVDEVSHPDLHGARGDLNALVADQLSPGVLNPLPAVGGSDPEPLRQVRQDAPQAFKQQERAITAADYAEILQRHPKVQRAVATFRWTGSWTTVFVAVDPVGGTDFDEELEQELLAWLDRYRLAGRDLRIDGPRYVALEIELQVCTAAGRLRSEVRSRLLQRFSNRVLPDGSQGWFHPDRLSFGQPVYVSQLVAEAMAVPGVHSVDPVVVRRFDREAAAVDGVLSMDRLEIPRLDNDPDRQENGVIRFNMEGGL